MKRETTIKHLVRAVAEGFGHMDFRFDEVNTRLDRLAQNLFADHERRLARLEEALTPSRR